MKIVRSALAVVAVVGVLGLLLTWPFFGQPLLDSVRATPVDAGCDEAPGGPAALVAFDLATGDLIWEATVGGPLVHATRDGAAVRVHSSTYLRHFDLATGQIVSCDAVRSTAQLDQRDDTPGPLAGSEDNYSFGTFDPARESGAQLIGLEVTHADTGAELWRKTVPGYRFGVTHHVSAGLVLVADQTGGTGFMSFNGSVQSKLSAYDIETGAQRWQVDLAYQGGTPEELGPDLVAVPTQTDVTLFDTGTGATIWSADHGSPGKGGLFGSYTEPGGYDRFFVDLETNVLVGLIQAERPYRD